MEKLKCWAILFGCMLIASLVFLILHFIIGEYLPKGATAFIGFALGSIAGKIGSEPFFDLELKKIYGK